MRKWHLKGGTHRLYILAGAQRTVGLSWRRQWMTANGEPAVREYDKDGVTQGS
jgi:hypothetical protein